MRPQARRGLHHVPQLGYDEAFRRNGVPGLLSPEGFELAWMQYQGLLVDKLNQMTAGMYSGASALGLGVDRKNTGTVDENAPALTLLLTYARDAQMASLFNYASMAYNNHFFFNCLVGSLFVRSHLARAY